MACSASSASAFKFVLRHFSSVSGSPSDHTHTGKRYDAAYVYICSTIHERSLLILQYVYDTIRSNYRHGNFWKTRDVNHVTSDSS